MLTEIPHSILVLCTHNSVRSPVCEAILKQSLGNRAFVTSAGIDVQDKENIHIVQVAKELGFDISNHNPRSCYELDDDFYDMVIALSAPAYKFAKENYKNQPTIIEHWNISEPPGLLCGMSQNQLKECYKQICLEMQRSVANKFSSIIH